MNPRKFKLVRKKLDLVLLCFVESFFLVPCYVFQAPVMTYVVFIGIGLGFYLLAVFVPEILIVDNQISRRYWWGWKSKVVDLNNVVSMQTWRLFTKNSITVYVELEDVTGKRIRIPMGYGGYMNRVGPIWQDYDELRSALVTALRNVDQEPTELDRWLFGSVA